MLLSEQSAPFKRRRVIEYAVAGNNTVRHWRELRNVAGPLYMSEPVTDKWGYKLFSLYLIFPEIPDGVIYRHDMINPAHYTDDGLLDEVQKSGCDTPGHFVATLDKMIADQHFVGNALIEFVRQWDPERAETYARYREEYYARKREEHQRLEQEREEKRKAEQAEQEAADKAARAEYLGWADSMTAMRFGRVSATMERLFRYDGVIMSRKQFVLSRIRDGWRPDKKEGQTSWRRIHLEWVESNPRTEYRLVKDNLCIQICKMEYDFACYLVKNNVMDILGAA